MALILIVEDEVSIAKGLEINLKGAGYTVTRVTRGDQAVAAVLREDPDLVLLDVMLPGMSGVDVCRELRSRRINTPIIMLTAKAEEIDRVLGLEIGADDYVTKPFSMRELLARVRLRLKKQRSGSSSAPACYAIEGVEIDFERRTAVRAGVSLELAPKELEVLRYLVQHRGEVVTRDQLLDEVWGYDTTPTTRTIDTHILRLRQKLEPNPPSPVHILSVYGEGYRFVD